MKSLIWDGSSLKILDQRKLPLEKIYNKCTTYQEVTDAIKSMQVRGAPAIGIAAAFAIVMASKQRSFNDLTEMKKYLSNVSEELQKTRPTAVNLFWSLERMRRVWNNANTNVKKVIEQLEKEALSILEEDVQLNKRIGNNGQKLLPAKAAVLTHCNAGSLATADYGTALGVIRAAVESQKKITVFACETRPRLQGAKLTVTELLNDGIDVTLITDSTAGYLMQQGKIDLVIVGADRIAANGDVANKIGTYSLAVLAAYHHIPFYVAAPYSTFDMSLASGEEIIVEERDADEVRSIEGVRITLEEVKVYNPAFDITPSKLITAIVTDRGVITPPYEKNLRILGEEK